MTVPLHEVKSRFSEFVNYVQDGDVVYITKHNKPFAVMISYEDYKKTPHKKTFFEAYLEWKDSCDPDVTDDGTDPWANIRDTDPDGGRKPLEWD